MHGCFMASSEVQLSNMTNWHARKHQCIAVPETFLCLFLEIIKKNGLFLGSTKFLFSKTKAKDLNNAVMTKTDSWFFDTNGSHAIHKKQSINE